jgi:hypothetical protein
MITASRLATVCNMMYSVNEEVNHRQANTVMFIAEAKHSEPPTCTL